MIDESEHQTYILDGTHQDPHSYLGLHVDGEGKKWVRLFRPKEKELSIDLRGVLHECIPLGNGFFALEVPQDLGEQEYKVPFASGMYAHDPYVFRSILQEEQVNAFHEGTLFDAYAHMGGRCKTIDGILGATFVVWAPRAKSVHLIADCNHFERGTLPMKKNRELWELFVPGIVEGEKYKFSLLALDGGIRDKSDPYELYSEMRPQTASILIDPFKEQKDTPRVLCRKSFEEEPMSIYEFHMGSWVKEGQAFPNYRSVAKKLAAYCKKMHFTHVEVLPISGHPLDESWGYQVTGYFGVTSRYGTPNDFQFFVDHMHSHGIGVILDWVPAHFPQDDFSFACFDGAPLYEHADPLRGFHPQWTTNIFDYAKKEVQTFLLSSALFYLEVMNVDGIRVDAVSSMLFLDYERKEGEWTPNEFGGNQNLDAIGFLKTLNTVVHKRNPQALMIAEESHAFPGVTKSVEEGGLGFDMKWNLGWMNDTLHFFSHEYAYRHHELKHLYFTQVYMHEEKYLLVLSHDEVVHEKKSLLEKMPGDEWQQFASLRMLFTYMMTFPGKKLLFMGGEIGQRNEWDCKAEIHWDLLSEPLHRQLQDYVKDLQEMYKTHASLWSDYTVGTFTHIETTCDHSCVLAYTRQKEEERLIVFHNFLALEQTVSMLSFSNTIEPILSSNDEKYGGNGFSDMIVKNDTGKVQLRLPPLTSLLCKVL